MGQIEHVVRICCPTIRECGKRYIGELLNLAQILSSAGPHAGWCGGWGEKNPRLPDFADMLTLLNLGHPPMSRGRRSAAPGDF